MNFEIILLILVGLNIAGTMYLIGRGKLKQNSQIKNQIVVDTSGLIDGRILDIVNTGFVPQSIIIPKFVISELQLLADKSDHLKRERARFGLAVVKKLQEIAGSEVKILGADNDADTVDAKLVKLARRNNAMLYTTDFNLNQVAQIEGVKVLNVNELAQGIRMTNLPGEKAEIKITQQGQDKKQGVGYLDDGTMVVVEKAGSLIGKKVKVEFSRVLQTQAGKMMFASLENSNNKNNKHHSHKS